MDVNETVMAWTTKRSIILPFLLIVLLAVSIMCLPACSSDNAGVPPNYIVQATVSVEDDGSVAFALVMDGEKNLVSTPILSMNGQSMDIGFFLDPDVDGSGTEGGSPYYFLELPDLKGGDTVQFMAVSPSGAKIYAPPPAVIPMTIELLDPQEGQEITAGDEVLIRWTGGEGAEVFSAAYTALDGSAEFSEDFPSGGAGEVTVPSGQTVAGAAIFGVGAITGDVNVLDSFDSDFISQESFFLITRSVAVAALVNNYLATSSSAQTVKCDRVRVAFAANFACAGEFAAFGIGAIVWENRRQAELKVCANEKCRKTTNNFQYCVGYGRCFGHARWSTRCVQCGGVQWADVGWRDDWTDCVQPGKPCN